MRFRLFALFELVVLILVCLVLFGSFAPAWAQMDPRTLPRFDPSRVTFAGRITLPSVDSRGMLIEYGAGAAGFSEDGTLLYVGCRQKASGHVGQDGRGMIWTGTVPPIGGTSKEVAPCTGITPAALSTGITGDPGCYFPLFGGVTQHGGRVILNGYCTYDGDGRASRKTWWVGKDFASLTGPVEGSVRNGLVMREISRIPPEWHTLLGGDCGVTTGYTSIISRASYGPSFTTFDCEDVGTPGFTMNFLLGCPEVDPANGAPTGCAKYWQHNSPPDLAHYGGSEHSAGLFIAPGTRTLVALVREAKGPMCYGYPTTDPTLHGKPRLDAVYCYSLVDNPNYKGPTGYPYVFLALLFDLNDLVAVKEGKMKPWDVAPYASHVMPTSSDGFSVGYTGSAAFNAKTGLQYLFRELFPNGRGGADVDVFSGFPKEGDNAPVPIDCDYTWGPWVRVKGSESACTGTPPKRTFIEESHIIKKRDAENGGLACPASPQIQQGTEDCTLPPIEFDARCTVNTITGLAECKGKVVPPPGGSQ